MGSRARFGGTLQVSVFTILVSASLFQALDLPAGLLWTRQVPSGSMKPAIYDGDYVLGFGKPSPPASPARRGDVVVFRLPSNPATEYMKRVVGLPGESVQMIDGVLHIDGQPVKRERLGDFVDGDGPARRRWRETLPNGVSYQTIDMVEHGFYATTPVYVVPPGHYFMLGDNRDNSADSRSLVGYVPSDNIVGRAGLVYFSIDHSVPLGFRSVRWSRLFTIVR